jgi:hypothetical protein
MSRSDKVSAAAFFCISLGRGRRGRGYSNITPYYSKNKSQCKTLSEEIAFDTLKLFFIWSIKSKLDHGNLSEYSYIPFRFQFLITTLAYLQCLYTTFDMY